MGTAARRLTDERRLAFLLLEAFLLTDALTACLLEEVDLAYEICPPSDNTPASNMLATNNKARELKIFMQSATK
ncbi:MAG: hypothetical protein MUQ14_09125, partial [Burkholderiaceae bacterium]|nr:hypothetical protein [Burkholderiaceae bacterium]